MINNLNILLPEIFLSLSIFTILMLGVFIKKSFNIVFNLSLLILILTITIILNNPNNEEKIFLDSFIRDGFSNYFKILILISSSGKSKNMIKGIKAARKKKFKSVISFTGFEKKNYLNENSDISLWVNSKKYNLIENSHQFYLLMIVDLMKKIKK